MGIVEIWERCKSSSEVEPYQVSEDSRYEESSERSYYDPGNGWINLFENDAAKRRFRHYSDSEERRMDEFDSNEEGEEDASDLESYYSVKGESEGDEMDYMTEWNKLQQIRASNNIYCNVDMVPRTWHSVFYISTIHNLETVPQNYFYYIRFSHVNPNASSILEEIKMYTPLYNLRPGERHTLSVPIFLWKKKRLVIPYGEFKNYIITIELWKTHTFTLNTLHAEQTLTFQDIIENKSNFTISLNMTVPKITEGGDRELDVITEESERSIPVHKLNVVMLLEEIFDFAFVFENWWFTPVADLPSAFAHAPKTIKISVQSEMGGRWATRTSEASHDDYWPAPGVFLFTGTIRQLKISYFIVKVFCVTGKKMWKKSTTLLGTCVMSLKSVKEYPLVRGMVKKLAIGTQNMQSGMIQGNIRCCLKSAGLGYFEDLKNRPAQPISGSALLTHLDKSCQYLVIRLLRCENLPATNTDTNASDPLVKVKWDGIVNFTSTLESTTSPVYNQNMYFPVHLVDTSELVEPLLVKHSLPIDLASKGPVIMEVWDSDDTSSEFLGGVEIPLSRLYRYGMMYSRSLVDGLYNEASKNAMGSDEAPDHGDMFSYSGFSNDVDVKYPTRVYSDTVTLTGYTVPHRGLKPTITFEMYILPPMPDDLYIPNDQKRQVKSDTYRELSRRWDSEFDLWQRMYRSQTLSKFPHRRFLNTTFNNTLTRDAYPSEITVLSSFVTPIQMSSQLSPPGELLHWISNFGLREDSVERVGDLTKIESWQHPSRLLTTKKGGLHDRALLLCSCLLGLGYDAYVCKGTLKVGRVEHCWVMTRHSDSTVSFWETANKNIWHLPKRWNMAVYEENLYEDVREPSAPLLDNYENITFRPSNPQEMKEKMKHVKRKQVGLTNFEMYGDHYIPEQKVDVSKLLGRQEKLEYDSWTKNCNLGKMLYELPHMKQKSATAVNQIKPKEELLVPFETLVHLPYSSIETVFNHKQLWGNLQHYHPSCILYDLDKPTQWKPFLKVPLQDEFLSNIQITAPPSDYTCKETSKDIINEIGEMIRLMRGYKGLKSSISKDAQMHERLESFLDILEYRERLDPQFDPGMPPHLVGWSNSKEIKKMIKNRKTQGLFDHMQRAANFDEYSDLSTELSSSSNQCGTKNPLVKEGDDNQNQEQVPGQTEQVVQEQNEQHSGRKEDNEEKRREVKQVSNRRSRSRRRRTDRRTERRSKPTKRLEHDPKHSSCTIRRVKSCELEAGGFKLRKRSVVKQTILPKPKPAKKRKEPQTRYKTLDSTVPLEVPGFQFFTMFDKVKTPSSSGSRATPGSDLSEISAQSSGFANRPEIIKSAMHRMMPHLQNREPVSKKFRSSVQKRNMRLTTHMSQQSYLVRAKKKLFRFGNKLANSIPSAHKIPGFVEDMQKMVPIPEYHKEYMYGNYKIPYEFKVYESKEIAKWYCYYNAEAMQYAWQRSLPVPANHTFVGIPVHFCTSDINEIRDILYTNPRLNRVIVNNLYDADFVIFAKVYPLLGNLLSTWIFIGCHVPWRI